LAQVATLKLAERSRREMLIEGNIYRRG
jgi:hypothetical protein